MFHEGITRLVLPSIFLRSLFRPDQFFSAQIGEDYRKLETRKDQDRPYHKLLGPLQESR